MTTELSTAPAHGAPEPREAAPALRRKSNSSFTQRYALFGIWIAIIAIFAIATDGSFLNVGNFVNMFSSQSVLLLLALGLLLPLTTNDFDMSVGAVVTLSSMLLSVVNVNFGLPLGVGILCGILAGMAVGLVNAILVVIIGIDSFIVTLGMSTLVAGIVYWFSGSAAITGVDSALVDAVLRFRPLGIPMIFFYAIFAALVIWYILEFTPIGRQMLFVGRGRSVAQLSGVKVRRVRMFSLIACSTVASIAGVVLSGTTGGGDPTSGATFLLPALAAAFLGTTVLRPGRINVWGTVIAVYFLVTGISGLQQLGVPNFVQQLFYGAALLIAVAISTLLKKRETKLG